MICALRLVVRLSLFPVLLSFLVIGKTQGFLLGRTSRTLYEGQRCNVAKPRFDDYRNSKIDLSSSQQHQEDDSSSSPLEQVVSSSSGVRLNKAFKSTHSRRQADRLIADGRVTVNGRVPETMGVRLHPGDVVTLDGRKVAWRRLTMTNDDDGIDQQEMEKSNSHHSSAQTRKKAKELSHRSPFVYIKYWKPRGVECTTNRSVRHNILDALGDVPGVTDRLWPMGRLDKESSGILILTSDGQTTQRVLKSSSNKQKVYLIETNYQATEEDLRRLSTGVRIQSHTSRDGKTNVRWITTKSAVVERGPHFTRGYPNQLRFVLTEGKNRQIRRMCESIGLRVRRLHRIDFCGIGLDGCEGGPGSWAFLNERDMAMLLENTTPPDEEQQTDLHP